MGPLLLKALSGISDSVTGKESLKLLGKGNPIVLKYV